MIAISLWSCYQFLVILIILFMLTKSWNLVSIGQNCLGTAHPHAKLTLVTVLIDPPSYWSPNITLGTQPSLVPHLIGSPNVALVTGFSLVPHHIGPPRKPWLHFSLPPPILLIPQCDTLVTQFSLVSYFIDPPPQCNLGYTVFNLIGPQT